MELDHIVIAVTDLDVAASAYNEDHHLASIVGGRHPGWGTANRIVPLGDAYLELIAVVDEGEAVESMLGRWVAGNAPLRAIFSAGPLALRTSTRSHSGSASRRFQDPV